MKSLSTSEYSRSILVNCASVFSLFILGMLLGGTILMPFSGIFSSSYLPTTFKSDTAKGQFLGSTQPYAVCRLKIHFETAKECSITFYYGSAENQSRGTPINFTQFPSVIELFDLSGNPWFNSTVRALNATPSEMAARQLLGIPASYVTVESARAFYHVETRDNTYFILGFTFEFDLTLKTPDGTWYHYLAFLDNTQYRDVYPGGFVVWQQESLLGQPFTHIICEITGGSSVSFCFDDFSLSHTRGYNGEEFTFRGSYANLIRGHNTFILSESTLKSPGAAFFYLILCIIAGAAVPLVAVFIKKWYYYYWALPISGWILAILSIFLYNYPSFSPGTLGTYFLLQWMIICVLIGAGCVVIKPVKPKRRMKSYEERVEKQEKMMAGLDDTYEKTPEELEEERKKLEEKRKEGQEVTYYDILGVPTNATRAEIKSAYMALAKMYHPDVLGEQPERIKAFAEEEMARINEAYNTLKDTAKRLEYDRELAIKKGLRVAGIQYTDPSYVRASAMNMNVNMEYSSGTQSSRPSSGPSESRTQSGKKSSSGSEGQAESVYEKKSEKKVVEEDSEQKDNLKSAPKQEKLKDVLKEKSDKKKETAKKSDVDSKKVENSRDDKTLEKSKEKKSVQK